MANTLSVIGIDPKELHWIRALVHLLRHPDPSVPELARQAMIYLTRGVEEKPLRGSQARNRAV